MKLKLSLSYGWKLGIIITFISVAISTTCVFFFYLISYRNMMKEIDNSMLYVGRLGVMLFNEEARQAIKRLNAATERDAFVTPEQVAAMKTGEILSSLSSEDIERYHNSDDFQLLLNILSTISLATVQDMEPKQAIYRIAAPRHFIERGGFGAYLAVTTKLSPDKTVLKYIASCAPVPTSDGWPGNPIGNLEKSWQSLAFLFEGKSYTDDRLFTDFYYTALSVTVPILDSDGSTIAVLCLDYAAQNERNKLYLMGYISLSLIFGSLLFASISAYYINRTLNRSLRQLHDAALQVASDDFTAVVDIKTNDEFSTLGTVFNRMVANIKNFVTTLENKNKQLATIVLDMHDGVGAILTSILINSTKAIEQPAAPDYVIPQLTAINNLARQGMAEVRLLMNALDYDYYDYSVILDEIRLQGADILVPSGITLDLQILGVQPTAHLAFVDFLDLQRIFREIFVNIVKHAGATSCMVIIDFQPKTITFHISDNGTLAKSITNGHGRGLQSIAGRLQRLGGSFTHRLDDGFHLSLIIPQPTRNTPMEQDLRA